MSRTRKLYQHIYQQFPWYGDSSVNKCPGVRLLPIYQGWLLPPVLDLGCGRGDTVQTIRALGLEADGIDQVDLGNGMRVGSIIDPIEDIHRFSTVLCIDCIEHLEDSELRHLFINMTYVQRQIFSINISSATNTGRELHVNRKRFEEWDAIVRERFNVLELVQTSPEQRLYLTEGRPAEGTRAKLTSRVPR
jgi:hypothetical protein